MCPCTGIEMVPTILCLHSPEPLFSFNNFCCVHLVTTIIYRIVQNFDRGKFWRFWHFPARPSKFNPSNCFKTIQHLLVYGKRQWPSVKLFSVKYLNSQYPSKFPPVKIILCYTVSLWSPSNAEIVKVKSASIHCKQGRYGFPKISPYNSYGR